MNKWQRIFPEKVKFIGTKGMSDKEWLESRKYGVGASEVGSLLGLNPYKSPGELLYQKIGRTPVERKMNSSMMAGTVNEKGVAIMWQHWDPDNPDSDVCADNYQKGVVKRKCQKINYVLKNEKYPELFGNMDRVISKQWNGRTGVLECKCTRKMHADMWEAGVPPSFVAQVQTYLMITGLEYAEIAMLLDGDTMDVIPIEASEKSQKNIAEASRAFYEDVKLARKYDQQGKEHKVEEIEAKYRDDSEAYEKFLSKKFREDPSLIITPQDENYDSIYKYAVEHKKLNDEKKIVEERMRGYSNPIKDMMREAVEVDFGDEGKITWREDKKGSRRFRNNVKLPEFTSEI